jgi:sodium transport system permease protein
MKGLFTVFRKEVKENLRDRRSLLSSLIFGPLIGPLIFSIMIGTIAQMEINKAEKPLHLPVNGAEHAPELVAFLKHQGVIIEAPVEDPSSAVRSTDEEIIIVITEEFGKNLSEARPAPVELVLDNSRRTARSKISRTRNLLRAYGSQIGKLRLLVRGIDPSIGQALTLEERDLATPSSRGALILSMLPYFLMLSVFTGGLYLAIDTTAGEKERQSLEPLLCLPVPRWQIMSGKLLATFVFSVLSLILTLIAFRICMQFIPAEKMGLQLQLDVHTLWITFLLMLPVAVFAASLQTIIAAFAKGFREAQTYLSLNLLVPMIPSVTLIVLPVKSVLWMLSIPIFSQALLLEKLLRGEDVILLDALLCVFTTLVAGSMLAYIAARLYKSDTLALA